MKKTVFVSKLIYTFFTLILLLSLFIKSVDIRTKIMVLPFIICAFASVGKTICLMLDKNKLANIFSKIFVIGFLVFWFGSLVFGCYLLIKAENYFGILFLIPFFIIGIYLVRRFLLNKTIDYSNRKKSSRFNFAIIVPALLVLIILFSGIVILIIGVKDTYTLNNISKNYATVEGYFRDYEIYNIDEKEGTVTYKLIYDYHVNGEKYTVSTDYGVGYIPEYGSIREIKYNPESPDEAILVGTNKSNGLIFFGAFFTLGAFVFVLIALQSLGLFDKVKFDIIGTYIGFVFLVIGIGIILFQIGTVSSFMELIKSMRFWLLIPLLFIIVGIFQIVKCLFIKK